MKNRSSRSIKTSALVLAFAVGGAAVALAQADDQESPAYGTTASPTFDAEARAQLAPLAAAPITPFKSWKEQFQYATGGVALRNRRGGGIGISGVVLPVKDAYIYWAFIDNGAPTKPATLAATKIRVQRLLPTPESAQMELPGTLVDSGPQPCWISGSTIYVYRAQLPVALGVTNGSYQVTTLPFAGGDVNGGDPWVVRPRLPLWEGASIVVIGKGSNTVDLFDKGLAGKAVKPPFSYTLMLSGSTRSLPVLWDNIGADGQLGTGRVATASDSGETTTINGLLVAGPGSTQNLTGDWNGSSGFPLPQLWDDTGHQFTLYPTLTTTLSITFGPATGATDCLTGVANLVAY